MTGATMYCVVIKPMVPITINALFEFVSLSMFHDERASQNRHFAARQDKDMRKMSFLKGAVVLR